MNILRNSACAMLASAFLCSVYAAEVCESVKDAKLIAQDDKNTYLGKIANRYDTDDLQRVWDSRGPLFDRLHLEQVWELWQRIQLLCATE
jgi:hypothetical protein